MSHELQPLITANRRLLGNSNTFMKNRPGLEHITDGLAEILEGVNELVIVPYALHDMDVVEREVGAVLRSVGIRSIRSTHEHPGSEQLMLQDAGAVYVSGGNTGRLVANLHALRNADGSYVDGRLNAAQQPIAETIRVRASEGVAVVGSSAGVNVMCGDVRTTNDMQAAVQIQADGGHVLRIDGLGLLPPNLNINPHYQDPFDDTLTSDERAAILEAYPHLTQFLDHQGENRPERIAQILEMDPTRTVLALREGAYIVVNGMQAELRGAKGGVIFEADEEPQVVDPGNDISHLLQ